MARWCSSSASLVTVSFTRRSWSVHSVVKRERPRRTSIPLRRAPEHLAFRGPPSSLRAPRPSLHAARRRGAERTRRPMETRARSHIPRTANPSRIHSTSTAAHPFRIPSRSTPVDRYRDRPTARRPHAGTRDGEGRAIRWTTSELLRARSSDPAAQIPVHLNSGNRSLGRSTTRVHSASGVWLDALARNVMVSLRIPPPPERS